MLKRTIIIVHMVLVGVMVAVNAASSVMTHYTWNECQGSARPYPVPERAVDYPDTLTPVMINHVGRHGARYAASPGHVKHLMKALKDAEKQGTITALGRRLEALAERVETMTDGRWGQLDSLGMVEQQGIAARMYATYPELFTGKVSAISSYVPRCVMSMYEFLHRISLCNPKVEISARSGMQFSDIVRFFDSEAYKSTVKSEPYKKVVDDFTAQNVTMAPLRRVLGYGYQFDHDSLSIAMDEYTLLAGLEAIGVRENIAKYLTLEEQNRLWSVFNFRQYIDRTATVLSSEPANDAMPLLENLVSTTDAMVRGDTTVAPVMLRFGHAETLMPLLSLMRLPGCYYLTYNYDTVCQHWRDFDIVPMAANMQMILFRSDSGRYYVRVDLNERPVPLMPGSSEIYTPWSKARAHLLLL
ncbi:MAG: hypothetical protein NC111_04945 [Bacteroides sp.]|nr:hypothetical protein [Bacteroides sp.]MCM1413674.1 hypothetical protein [Bacteroides sp.]MCM1471853.1 hypothetical protein [Bacteroides sp.]